MVSIPDDFTRKINAVITWNYTTSFMNVMYRMCCNTQFSLQTNNHNVNALKKYTGNIPMLLVTPTHLPWNQSSHKSQHIIKRLLCGFLQMHQSLSGSSSEFQLSSELSASESSSSSSSALFISASDNRLLCFNVSKTKQVLWLMNNYDKNEMQKQIQWLFNNSAGGLYRNIRLWHFMT